MTSVLMSGLSCKLTEQQPRALAECWREILTLMDILTIWVSFSQQSC